MRMTRSERKLQALPALRGSIGMVAKKLRVAPAHPEPCRLRVLSVLVVDLATRVSVPDT